MDGEFNCEREGKGMRILVLGGKGFVGAHLTSALRAKDLAVVSVSRRDGIDIRNYSAVEALLREVQPTVIFNLAAHTGGVHYLSMFEADVWHDNTQMTLNLYKAVKSVCPSVRVINALANCSYPGDVKIQSERCWLQGDVHKSVYAYGHSRRFIYLTSLFYYNQHRIYSTNLIFPNAFGPGDSTDPKKTHALNGMIIRMIRAKRAQEPEFEVWGSGKPEREWIYIDDFVAILMQALNIERELIYPVNVAQNRGYSILESARLIAKIVGFQGQIKTNDSYQDGAPCKILDNQRFRQIFPDFRFTDHEEGIRRTVNYYEAVL